MLFNSFSFLIFFFAVVCAYQLPLPWSAKKIFLTVASYFFYACWNPPFIFLLWISTLMDWFLARGLYALRESAWKRFFLVLSLLMNLGLLGVFKYGNFFLENLETLSNWLGAGWNFSHLEILLPVGISFYTFQTLSYTLDVYMGKRAPARSFLDYALYIAFFPQLVAGPIVRSEDFIPQCTEPRRPTRSQFHWGLSLMIVGLFEKMVIADFFMAPAVEKVYSSSAAPFFADAWLGTLAFSIQIFCDFAGYSTCAIGAALCFGFVLTRNFHFPYASLGFSDFWRRWHISLSTWLRDYLYIPLGGNRKGTFHTYRNLMLTMLLGGLWHGASWTFVVWGGIHGIFLCLERGLKNIAGSWAVWSGPGLRIVLGGLTYLGVCFAWVFFRSESLERSFEMIKAMTSMPSRPFLLSPYQAGMILMITSTVVLIHAFMRRQTLKRIAVRTPAWLRVFALMAMVILMWTTSGEDRAFIYFQF